MAKEEEHLPRRQCAPFLGLYLFFSDLTPMASDVGVSCVIQHSLVSLIQP